MFIACGIFDFIEEENLFKKPYYVNFVSRRVLNNSKYALPMRARVSSMRHFLATLPQSTLRARASSGTRGGVPKFAEGFQKQG